MYRSVPSTKALVIIFFILILLGFISIIYIAQNPLYFIKSVTVKPTHNMQKLLKNNSHTNLNIKAIIKRIPYKGDYLYTVLPEKRYQQTIIEGYGDCSNLSNGLAYYLSKIGQPYQIIHFLRVQPFLDGGHVALQTTYKYNDHDYTGIIDVLEGGLPKNKNGFISVKQLFNKKTRKISIESLNALKGEQSVYYSTDFLNKVVIGVMPSNEVNKYFKFLSTYYINIGNDKIEQYIYIMLSIITNKYPTIYLREKDYKKLFFGHALTKSLSNLSLWVIWINLLITPLILFGIIYTKLKRS